VRLLVAAIGAIYLRRGGRRNVAHRYGAHLK